MSENITLKEQELKDLSKYILTNFPDRSTRWVLEDKESIRGLLQILANDIVQLIDFSQLELQNRSFLSSKLQEQVSDLIFSVPFKSGDETDELLIYILIEHQSTVDISMGFRLLFYMMHIWDEQRQRWLADNVPKSEWRLRPILPIVFYSGNRRWRVPLSVTAMMDIPEELTRYVPDFDTLIINVKEMDTTEFTKTGHPFGWLLAVLKNEDADKDTLIETFTEAITNLNSLEPEQAEYRIRVLHYFVMLIANRRPSEEHIELLNLVNHLSDEEEVKLMAKSMIDVTLEQGKEEGREEGIAIGETQAKRDVVIKLLTHQFPDVSDTVVTAIHEIQERSRLDTLFDQILTATSFDDIDLNGIGRD